MSSAGGGAIRTARSGGVVFPVLQSIVHAAFDQPDNAATRVRVYAATAGALMRWEPRLRLSRVRWQSSSGAGQAVMQIEGVYTPRGRAAQPVNLPIELGATA